MSGLAHVHERIYDLVLGQLAEAEALEAESHLGECASCREEYAAVSDDLAALALAVPSVAPSEGARERLLAATAERGGRFSRFLARVAEHLDLALDEAAEFLEHLDDPERWAPAMAGIEYLAMTPGPRLREATIGILRVQPGALFPRHRHLGPESVLVLQGGIRDEDGTAYHPGEVQKKDEGTTHTFTGLPGEPCICLGVILGSVEFFEPFEAQPVR